jgi:hypothetical protein
METTFGEALDLLVQHGVVPATHLDDGTYEMQTAVLGTRDELRERLAAFPELPAGEIIYAMHPTPVIFERRDGTYSWRPAMLP